MALDDFYTKSLLHFNGIDDSTTFTDESGLLITPSGGAHIHTPEKKFGSASGAFGAAGDKIKFDNTNAVDHDFGTGDFTIDWWEYPTAGYHACISRDSGENGTYSGFNTVTSGGGLYLAVPGPNWMVTNRNLGSVSQNVWTHYAIVRFGNTFYTFKGGVQQDTWTSSASILVGSSGIVIGQDRGQFTDYTGFVDEFRISKGIARWVSTFTPLNREYYPKKGLFSFIW